LSFIIIIIIIIMAKQQIVELLNPSKN